MSKYDGKQAVSHKGQSPFISMLMLKRTKTKVY